MMSLCDGAELNLHATGRVADADDLVAATVEGDVLIAVIVPISVALGTADVFGLTIRNEQ